MAASYSVPSMVSLDTNFFFVSPPEVVYMHNICIVLYHLSLDML
jgi:hypothetical protein